jgi:ABC-type lipoprotein export system ATPase subunit
MTQTKTSSVASTNDSRAILRAAGLRKTFRMGDADVVVLKHVDLTVRRGEFLAIEGRSGSGKSTLLHILGALDSVDGGNVEFESRDYTLRPHKDKVALLRFLVGPWAWPACWISFVVWIASGIALILASQRFLATLWYSWLWLGAAFLVFLTAFVVGLLIRAVRQVRDDRIASPLRNKELGFVFQFYHLLPELNVLENTMLAPMIEHSWLFFRKKKRELRSRATKMLTELGLAHRLKHRPNQLSGGERQRVAIARALMNSPKVLFADEPTGNLDAETGRQIMNVLEKLHQDKGQTIVMVTHDRSLAREADRVLLLEDGRLKGEAVD